MSREDRLTRQADIIDNNKLKNANVTIVGAGGIGSHTALALARMGVDNIRLIDPDKVSIENVSSQGFDMVDVGKYKVDAVKQKIIRAVGVVIDTKTDYINESYNLKTRPNEMYILAVDNMQSRKVIADKIKIEGNGAFSAKLVINPAMGAEYLTVNTYNVNFNTRYDEHWHDKFMATWFTDDDGVQETCTAKATIYTTLTISGFICKIIKDCIMGNSYIKQVAFNLKDNQLVSMFDNNGGELT